MIRVIIESPYAGRVAENIHYARRAVRDSVLRGEAPIASHLLFTQDGILDDTKPGERQLGIEAGLAWSSVADYHAFYTDFGWSKGMLFALARCKDTGQKVVLRALDGPIDFPASDPLLAYINNQ